MLFCLVYLFCLPSFFLIFHIFVLCLMGGVDVQERAGAEEVRCARSGAGVSGIRESSGVGTENPAWVL